MENAKGASYKHGWVNDNNDTSDHLNEIYEKINKVKPLLQGKTKTPLAINWNLAGNAR